MIKILWAIDAFEDNKTLNKNILDYLSSFSQQSKITVTPVYLHRQSSLSAYPGFESPTWIENDLPNTERLVKEVLQGYEAPFMERPRVLTHTTSTVRATAEFLSDYAQSLEYHYIITGTHGRSGVERFLLGSFTESLINNAAVPIISISPRTAHKLGAQNLLFATDFGPQAHDAFQFSLRLARSTNSSLLIYHNLPHITPGLAQEGPNSSLFTVDGKLLNFPDFITHSLKEKRKTLEQWSQAASEIGVDLSYILDYGDRELDQTLLDIIAHQKIDQVIMEAQSGPYTAALLGSTTRKLIKAAVCPMVLLPHRLFEPREQPSMFKWSDQTDSPPF